MTPRAMPIEKLLTLNQEWNSNPLTLTVLHFVKLTFIIVKISSTLLPHNVYKTAIRSFVRTHLNSSLFSVPTLDVNEIYPEVSSLKDPELQSAQLAARARFLPDYTVRATTNLEYLRISAEHYLLARRLTVWVTKLHPQGKFPVHFFPFSPLMIHRGHTKMNCRCRVAGLHRLSMGCFTRSMAADLVSRPGIETDVTDIPFFSSAM